MSFAKSVTDTHAFGLNLKVIYSQLIQKYSGIAVALDGGVIYSLGENNLLKFLNDSGINGTKDSLNLGISVRNIGTKLKYQGEGDALPLSLALGLNYMLEIAGDHRLNIAFDLVKPVDLTVKIHSGVEYSFLNFLSIRAGSKIGYDTVQFTSGAGFNLDFVEIDYAFVSISSLNLNHRFSLTFKLDDYGKSYGKTYKLKRRTKK